MFGAEFLIDRRRMTKPRWKFLRWPGNTVANPVRQDVDFNFGQWRTFPWHPSFWVGTANSLQKKTLFRVPGNNRSTGVSSCKKSVAIVHPQFTVGLRVRGVAGVATIDENRPDLLLKEFDLIGCRLRLRSRNCCGRR